jgi:D-cysteine desulfhydrase
MSGLIDRAGLPALPLLSARTPVIHLQKMGLRIGHPNLWLKDDSQTEPIIGGSKIRAIELLLGDAIVHGVHHVKILGIATSNFAVAVAHHAGHAGLSSEALLFNAPRILANQQPAALARLKNLGTSVRTISRPECAIRNAIAHHHTARNMAGSVTLPIGGGSALGAVGHFLGAMELADQVKAGVLPEPRAIFAPLGSGGTAAGLLAGCNAGGLKCEVVAVLSGGRAHAHNVRQIARSIQCLVFGRPLPMCGSSLRVVEADRRTTYGVEPDAGRELRAELLQLEAIDLDRTYCSNAFRVFRAQAVLHREMPMLFWNTTPRSYRGSPSDAAWRTMRCA